MGIFVHANRANLMNMTDHLNYLINEALNDNRKHVLRTVNTIVGEILTEKYFTFERADLNEQAAAHLLFTDEFTVQALLVVNGKTDTMSVINIPLKLTWDDNPDITVEIDRNKQSVIEWGGTRPEDAITLREVLASHWDTFLN